MLVEEKAVLDSVARRKTQDLVFPPDPVGGRVVSDERVGSRIVVDQDASPLEGVEQRTIMLLHSGHRVISGRGAVPDADPELHGRPAIVLFVDRALELSA